MLFAVLVLRNFSKLGAFAFYNLLIMMSEFVFFFNCWILLKYSILLPEQLMTLISAAREHEIEFIYAISPGLDITFSNPKEVSTLKRKLDQVSVTMLPWLQCYLLWKLQYPAPLGSFSWAALMFPAPMLVWMPLNNSNGCVQIALPKWPVIIWI